MDPVSTGAECTRPQTNDDPSGMPEAPPGFASRSQINDDPSGMPEALPGFASCSQISDDPSGMPEAPPGFGSLTSFKLKRVPTNTTASNNSAPNGMEASILEIGGKSIERLKKSLRHKPTVQCSEFHVGPGKEQADFEKLKASVTTSQHLPKGVLRGCPQCADCQKVVARWKPYGLSRPELDEAPVFRPTKEEFMDPLPYIESIRPTAEQYGICRIIPPHPWKPPCLLKDKKLWGGSTFATRVQQIHKLQKRDNVLKKCRESILQRNKRQKTVKENLVGSSKIDNNQVGHDYTAEQFGFDTGPDFTLETFQKYADDFKLQYFQTSMDSNFNVPISKSEPSVENIEGEYWRIVENPTEEIEVLYGADLDTASFGSGFPKSSSTGIQTEDDEYVRSGWNLNNISKLTGSVLCFESNDIPGVIIPWLYAGMCFSSFCWHVEDHHLYSLNYLHMGAPKVWYGVPGKDALKFESTLKKHLTNLFEEQPYLLHNLVTQFSPSLLKSEGVPIHRCVQFEGEFVLTFPRAYHSGFNCGFNCAEAVNVAPVDWLPHGQTAIELYREQRRKITLSHDKLLLSSANEAVRILWHEEFMKSDRYNLMWTKACGANGILTRVLKARTAVEKVRRDYLCSSSQSRKMDASFDATERECVICHYDLYLSASGCTLCQEKYACLVHAQELCSCPWSLRFFLFRYETSELNRLIDALAGKMSAIHRWAATYLGLTVSSRATNRRGRVQGRVAENTSGEHDVCHSTISVEACVSPKESQFSQPLISCHKEAEVSQPLLCPKERKHDSKISSKEGNNTPQLSRQHSPNTLEKKLPSCEVRESSMPAEPNGTSSRVHATSISSSFLEAQGKLTDDLNRKNADLGRSILSEAANAVMSDTGNQQMTGLMSDEGTKRVLFPENAKRPEIVADKSIPQSPNKVRSVMLNSKLDAMQVDDDEGDCVILRVNSGSPKASNDGVTSPKQSSGTPFPPTVSKNAKSTIFKNTPIQNSLASKRQSGAATAAAPVKDALRIIPPGSVSGDMGSNLFGSWQSNSPVALDRGIRPPMATQSPRMATPVSPINISGSDFGRSVEPLEYGMVMPGKRWSSRRAIFPRGYKSRASYISIMDPTKTCNYISTIIDAGLEGPLFMVTVEQCSDEVFVHSTPLRCWDMVRERVNYEIRRQMDISRHQKKHFPSLQPPGFVNGLEMFGLLRPSILQAIEARDPNRVCAEYWNGKPNGQGIQSPSPVGATVDKEDQPSQVTEALSGNAAVALAAAASANPIQGLYKKATVEELTALLRALSCDQPDDPIRLEAIRLLDEDLKSRQS